MFRPHPLVLALSIVCLLPLHQADGEEPPNVLWIYVDDMSDWMGCYGHDAVPTPHIDALALEGVKFERAYMPSPVCSATRSALITGAMPTTLGLHRHRTMIKQSLPAAIITVPEILKDAGYLTFNEEKDDYNFLYDREQLYSSEFERPEMRGHLVGRDLSWLGQLKGKRFFGQIQLKGGKLGGESGAEHPMPSRVDPASVTVPPQYPDTPVMRQAIARHYEQVVETDEQVGAIVAALKQFGLWDDTVVFFFTDHGAPLPRAKQFLYEEGAKVPLIVRFPGSLESLGEPGSTRIDLVSGIDIAAATVGLAGLPIPESFEGIDLFADDYQPREFVIATRDRCGIAVDRIRAVRTDRYLYLRNFLDDRALYQSNYRDGFATFVDLRKLHDEGRLSDLQASYHQAESRPAEELYDLKSDPHQVRNLAAISAHSEALARHRSILETWIGETGDRGQQMDSPQELKAVYDRAKGKVEAREFDFLRGKDALQQ